MSIDTIADKGEAISIVEPLIPEEASKYRAPLNDLAVELASQSAGLRSSFPEGIRAPLADLVRSMNCSCSNLIEGHNTQARLSRIVWRSAQKHGIGRDLHQIPNPRSRAAPDQG
ncbi:hypothetical protein [Phaeovulum vinaykumarii]|uniref:hypothetical protein n=1 Tax=Phaeovulum vinaykumarii TaxID=407234 RepID=UPI00117A76D8|nr:hypothetical protein [Phaeovulum vinaykumarii]